MKATGVLAVTVTAGILIAGALAYEDHHRKNQALVMISECVQDKAEEAIQQGTHPYEIVVPYYRQMCTNELIASGDLVYME